MGYFWRIVVIFVVVVLVLLICQYLGINYFYPKFLEDIPDFRLI